MGPAWASFSVTHPAGSRVPSRMMPGAVPARPALPNLPRDGLLVPKLHWMNSAGSLAVTLLVAYLLVITAVVVLLVWANAHHRAAEQRRRDLWYLQSGMAAIDMMRGVDFENYVAARLGNAGFAVSTTPFTGDYGVDLIAKRGAECIAVQCKRYGKPVGVAAVQQVVAGALHYHCTSSMVVSNQEFTREAMVLAAEHRCRLVGRRKLVTPAW